ncbi:response regulator transcription factor, partial [Thermus sp.]|uniref:response regulator transcription factor n=1 Tax=Thermus sp. TaxID=275 RepID=UPI00307F61FE
GYSGPILFLTARDALEDRVRGLDLGGDDYLAKPFHLEEFMARVRALLRREARSKQARVQRGPLEVDLVDRTVRWWGRPVELAPKEFALLELFVLHPHRIFTPQELWERFFPESTSDSIVRVYVRKLREKLGAEVIRTLPSGYALGL